MTTVFFLSRKYGRCVEWKEAEQDFLTCGYHGHTDDWRELYCGYMCPQRGNCLLAMHVSNPRNTARVFLAG